MKNKGYLIIIVFVLLFLTACSKKEYVYFNLGCGNTEYYKCELKNNKLNCDVKYPTCENKEFLGWYEANNYEDKLNLYGTFTKDTIIYARWKDESKEIYSTHKEPSVIVDEPSSIIESSSYIEEPSSIMEEPSNIVVEEYTITLMLNDGTNTQFKKVRVKYGGVLPSISNIPTRTAYTFLGWYDSKTGGTQYYNEKNVPVVKKYTKTSNITLYGRWRENTLSIRYNSNGGTWKTSSNKYALNVDGTVIVKSTNEIYEQKVKYGDRLDSEGLVDCNGTIFNWTKKSAFTNSGKEYFIENKGIKKELNQKAQYTARQLAEYAGCDLSKNDCTATVKVNWALTTGLGSSIKLTDKAKTACNYVLNPDDLKIRLYRCPCKQYHNSSTSFSSYNCLSEAALPGGGTKIVMQGMGRGDDPYQTQIAKKTITFTRYQKGAFSYEQKGAVESEDTYEFAKAFIILFKGIFLDDYRLVVNNAGEIQFPTGTCTECYSEGFMISRYDSGKYKKIVDEIFEETKYFILVNDNGSLTYTNYTGTSKNDPTGVMKDWSSKNGMKFMDILKNMRTSTESEGFKFYRTSNIYDCRNLLVE